MRSRRRWHALLAAATLTGAAAAAAQTPAANESWPMFRGGRDIPPPRCPSCRKPVSEWQQALDTWQQSPATDAWRCDSCGYTGHIHELDFRRHGGFARTFIDIWGIHPSEAVPVDALLESLAGFSGCDWNYMYVSE